MRYVFKRRHVSDEKVEKRKFFYNTMDGDEVIKSRGGKFLEFQVKFLNLEKIKINFVVKVKTSNLLSFKNNIPKVPLLENYFSYVR